jgi:spoIIIJ-associated protein
MIEREKIAALVKEFFEQTGFLVEIKNAGWENEIFKIDLEIDSPQLLIGDQGQTLQDLQHLLRLISRKKFKETVFLDLDLNDYKKKKTAYLRELARSAADEVALAHQEKELPVMSAAERRIIHLELASRSDVMAESRGQEPKRQIVIKPS